MVTKSISSLATTLLLSIGSFVMANEDGKQSADLWLSDIDNGDFHSSWHNAAPAFQSTVNLNQWLNIAETARYPLGRTVSRHFNTQQSLNYVPGLGEGTFSRITYITSFENKPRGTEYLTMMQVNGAWKVAKYAIR